MKTVRHPRRPQLLDDPSATKTAGDSPVLILVHPGSLCGSADYNIGRLNACAARDEIASQLNGWNGRLLVLDGALSDELPSYRQLNEAIRQAVARCSTATGFGRRVDADDPDHSEIAVRHLREARIPLSTEVFVTGAWYHPGNDGGCVNGAFDALKAAGYRKASIDDSACSIDQGDDEDNQLDADENDDDEDVIGEKPTTTARAARRQRP